ncbi:MAG: methyltransferase family protein [Sphingomicrobium sp.]|jgi:protein-S-isoprenylcysteine O-methyltransferase Ste14
MGVLYAVPIGAPQLWLFDALALCFFVLVVRAALRRPKEAGANRDSSARAGIVVQTAGIFLVGIGPVHPLLPWAGISALAGLAGVLLLNGGAVALFASSSTTLGRNWSIEARTLEDHELVRTGPYARVRHPIYLAMLLFLLGLAVALGHWIQLVIAVPTFLIGTKMRTDAEERLLEQSFGEQFRNYRASTPAIFPKIA